MTVFFAVVVALGLVWAVLNLFAGDEVRQFGDPTSGLILAGIGAFGWVCVYFFR